MFFFEDSFLNLVPMSGTNSDVVGIASDTISIKMDMARRVVIPEIASFLRMIKFPTKVDLLGSIVVRRCWGEEACD